jgi:Fur family ferric uptake transcriptional regulator
MIQITHNQTTDKDYSRYLKSRGLKITEPRLRILRLFDKSDVRHLSAEDIYKFFQQDNYTDISLATIYRVLTQFEQADLLVRHRFESDKSVFELNDNGLHDHLVCVRCGRVVEFFDPIAKKRRIQTALERGFKLGDHSIYLYGQCIKCLDSDNTDNTTDNDR